MLFMPKSDYHVKTTKQSSFSPTFHCPILVWLSESPPQFPVLSVVVCSCSSSALRFNQLSVQRLASHIPWFIKSFNDCHISILSSSHQRSRFHSQSWMFSLFGPSSINLSNIQNQQFLKYSAGLVFCYMVEKVGVPFSWVMC